jgi:hypothetical protein
MGQIYDLEMARRRRMARQLRAAWGQWWDLWFVPSGLSPEDLERLTHEERRWGGMWAPGQKGDFRIPYASGSNR